MMENKFIRNGLLLIVGMVAAIYVSHSIYILFCGSVDKLIPTIYYLQASDDMFEENMYFSEMTEEETGILSDLSKGIEGFEDTMRGENYKYRVFMDEHIDEVMDIAGKNDKYIIYLNSIGSSLQQVKSYIENMAQLEENIFSLAKYLGLTLITCIVLLKFGDRTGFYILTAVVYFMATASVLSKGLSDYFVAAILSFLAKAFHSNFTYSDMKILKLYFMQELKEALMTVVIIDTIQQLYKNRKERLLLKNIYYVLESLDMQIIYLKNHYRSSSKYIARLKIFSGSIEDECRKKENKIKFYMRILSCGLFFLKIVRFQSEKKVRNQLEENKKQKENNRLLREKLKLIRTNSEVAYSTEEYIKLFEETKFLMIELGYSSR